MLAQRTEGAARLAHTRPQSAGPRRLAQDAPGERHHVAQAATVEQARHVPRGGPRDVLLAGVLPGVGPRP
jgi:hypothetical protein